MTPWDTYLDRIEVILRSSRTLDEAVARINLEMPVAVTKAAVKDAMRRRHRPAPSSLLGRDLGPASRRERLSHGDRQVEVPYYVHPDSMDPGEDRNPSTEPRPWSSGPQAPSRPVDVLVEGEEAPRRREILEDIKRFEPLCKFLQKGPVGFRDICDALDLSPAKAAKLIEDARKADIQIAVAHDHVGIQTDMPAHVQDTHIAPIAGERQKIGVISDTHLGSKYCMREQLRDFICYAYNQGVRTILHVGDVLDGCYTHSLFELTHTGLEDQAMDLAETLPQLEGLTYHGITGNHDETFWKHSGVNVGRMIQAHFQDMGRNDFTFYGDRDAFLQVSGIVVHLWHPSGSVAYAKSYGPQKKVESYTTVKPQLLLCGHWHQYCHIFERGIHAIACPTFQGSMSRFSRSLKGSQAQGGLILSWDLTNHGTIRNFILEKRTYFENEKPIQIYNQIDGEMVPPAVTRSTHAASYDKRYR